MSIDNDKVLLASMKPIWNNMNKGSPHRINFLTNGLAPHITVRPDSHKQQGVTDKNGQTKVFYANSPNSIYLQLTQLV
ncbi:hypothetical protein J3U21_04105 [Gilliamella sp. B2776]|uniref:hypothetical protein n=1 Tax=unclassified Gilliamella TaxID=2685620 RepID=UPI00226A2484|nr:MULTISPECIES: hypothetical protein [unclassified Gilliamella]MCX8649682.1 hypothetical protein [Gilliamella sp. B2779]MCX8654800.1 hypothetical protein [Gilliamella sp. B2737]MCX8656986.1 hypothetical protein [Gilliamella sp. B2894]MCX8665068.1 hypothetical protein [Gilliamella sp. B2887]MCX8691328.1 hypothetical protein [Gilliamella sp. B2776]